MDRDTRILVTIGAMAATKIILLNKVLPWMVRRSQQVAEDENGHPVINVLLPDGTTAKTRLNAPTVEEHNRLADMTNPLLDRANAAGPDEPNPLTEDEILLVMSTLPEGSVYECHPEHGWGFR